MKFEESQSLWHADVKGFYELILKPFTNFSLCSNCRIARNLKDLENNKGKPIMNREFLEKYLKYRETSSKLIFSPES